jgi:hypothetical protein
LGWHDLDDDPELVRAPDLADAADELERSQQAAYLDKS